MLYDYQGNLWFTSSRLGLLRLAKSPFKDVYGAIGMERKVINAIVNWQDGYYIGTDEGLDVVDEACHRQIENELTKQLDGKRIRCMYVDEQDHLWVCTYGSGLMEFGPDGSSWHYNADNGSFGNRARIVTGLSDGTILAAGDSGISFIRDHKVEKTIKNEDGLINSMILTALQRSDGTILAGSDGDGIAVLKDGEVTDMITREDGLSSGVILRMVKDPKSDGVFVVTSNSLCYLEPDGQIRVLEHFPYFNNYDIWVKDEDTLFVMSSAGIYVVERDGLVDDSDMAWELLDARRGLGTSLTANSWNCYNGNGELFLPCDTGVYIIDVDKYNSDIRSYRMQLASIKLLQTEDGLFRTILDDPESYEEVSASCGIAAAMINKGNPLHIKYINKATAGILKNISEDGRVLNVSGGTAVMKDREGYRGISRDWIQGWGQGLALAYLSKLLNYDKIRSDGAL